MKKSGAEIFVECLLREKIDTIFGFPGGVVLDVYNVLFDAPLRHILSRHEQGAVHAADGYARASGKPGVCLVTSGPGATNTVTGIATAYMDSVPIVVFTGQVPTRIIGNDAFQEADIVGITLPCTKHNYLVKDIADLARTIKEAFFIATTGRPGPVLVDLPKDVLAAKGDFKYPERAYIRGYNPTYEGHAGQIAKVVKIIARAKRPVILAGGGIIISGASEELRQLAEIGQIPVTTTLMGLGGFPATHALFLGMPGMHGIYTANMALSEADLLIAIGSRFDDRVTGNLEEFAPHAKIVHIDIDPTSIGKNVRGDYPVVGDAKKILSKMNPLLKKEEKDWLKDHEEWLREIEEWRKNHPLTYNNQGKKIKPQYVIEQINEATKGEAIITTEVGQNQMWTAQFYKFTKPRTLLSSGGLGTMGYGFPAAIGAQAAFPDKIVIDIAGDGSFQMNIQELATAVQYRLPVKVAILNNKYLGMVRQWQQLFYNRRYSYTCLNSNPDFVKIAEAYGAVGLRASEPEEVRPIIEQALAIPKPVVIDFEIDREENVYPMVPVGASIRRMLLA
ncbi:MAG: acetolactate synthase, large subunit, biosynthetic type [Nitrospinae bacterium RIFCSPLOWO2_12_FULL_45_22]|nr:MAG: acetolactate synthase, large subunit, biosynthetic type [Nitrospinae bacterium RIFCSPLOWO2_12_FULL_45_22]